MKRKGLQLCIWALMIPLGVFGQAPVSKTYHVTLPDSIERTLVREYVASNVSDPNWTISYIETQAGHYFAIDRNLGTLQVVELDGDITVNDFLVEADTVLFCGKSSQNLGVVGYFTVSQFFAGGFAYQVSDAPMMSSSTGQVRELNKMVTYVSGGIRKVVALGKTMSGIYCVVEMRCPLGSSMGDCQVGELSTSYFESICDIAVTDNYVVTAGFYWLTGNQLAVRVYDKNDIFTGGGLQDSAFILTPIGSNACDLIGSQLALSHVGSDYFALATFWNYGGGNPPTYWEGITVSGFNIPGATYYVNFINAVKLFHTQSTASWEIIDMTNQSNYMNSFYALTGSGATGSPANQSKIIELNYNNIIVYDISETEYTTSYRFLGIDDYNSKTQYVANGYRRSNKTELIFEVGIYHSQNPFDFNNNFTCLSAKLDKSLGYNIQRQSVYRPYAVSLPQMVSFVTNQGLNSNVYPVVLDCTK